MKEEYFMQVKTFEKEIQSGFLEKIVIALDKKASYYTKKGLIAYSYSGAGYFDKLQLSPITQLDKEHKREATWYMFRITDFVKTIPEVPFSKLCTYMIDKLDSKIEGLASKPRHSGISVIYRVTATDAPQDYEIIR